MYGSTTEISVPEAMTVAVTEDTLTAELSDGRTISVPLAWYPRLVHATPEERGNWALIGGGRGFTGPAWTRISAWRTCWRAGCCCARRPVSPAFREIRTLLHP